jgi:hypothetical protein
MDEMTNAANSEYLEHSEHSAHAEKKEYKSMDGINLSDIKAVVGSGDNGYGNGNDSCMWMIMMALFLFNDNDRGHRGHDGYHDGGHYGYCAPATQHDVCYGFDHQEEMAAITKTDNDVICGNFELQKEILCTTNDTQRQIAEGFCDIKSELKEQEIQALRDKVASKEIALSNQCQTQAILDNIGHFSTNPPCYPQVQPVYPNYGYPFGGGGYGGFDGKRDGFRNDCCC